VCLERTPYSTEFLLNKGLAILKIFSSRHLGFLLLQYFPTKPRGEPSGINGKKINKIFYWWCFISGNALRACCSQIQLHWALSQVGTYFENASLLGHSDTQKAFKDIS